MEDDLSPEYAKAGLTFSTHPANGYRGGECVLATDSSANPLRQCGRIPAAISEFAAVLILFTDLAAKFYVSEKSRSSRISGDGFDSGRFFVDSDT
jgi:hypothetical protein